MKHIVCAFDGSEHSSKAAYAAAEMAKRFDAELTLVYVVEPYVPPVDLPGVAAMDFVGPHQKAGEKVINDAAARMTRETGVKTVAEVRVGNAPMEIVHAAEDKKADLIVVGSRGHGTVKRLLIGSVADRVMHLAHGSVMVVK